MQMYNYHVIARLFPAFLTGVPFFVLYFYLLRPSLGDFMSELFALKIASDLTVGTALVFFSSQFNRFVSKEVFEKKIFKHGFHLPTTSSLLHSDKTFSGDFTLKVHRKIKEDFNISIPLPPEEQKDRKHSRQLIVEAVSLIRAKVGKGHLVHQHNVEYGFIRNLVGGSAIGLFFAIISAVAFHWIHPNSVAANASLFLCITYALILLCGKKLISSFGKSYSAVLIQEYMAK